jgi:phage gp46-like protein
MVAVDPDNEEFGLLPLELAYISIRSKLITLHRKDNSEQFDIKAIQQTVEQLSSCLNNTQAMKANCTASKTSIDKIYNDINQMESGVKLQLSTLRSQLGFS